MARPIPVAQLSSTHCTQMEALLEKGGPAFCASGQSVKTQAAPPGGRRREALIFHARHPHSQAPPIYLSAKATKERGSWGPLAADTHDSWEWVDRRSEGKRQGWCCLKLNLNFR